MQEKVANADALAFIAPVYFVGFPAIVKGWIERVFTLGFAFELTPDAWKGDIGGRVPLLKHGKALIIDNLRRTRVPCRIWRGDESAH